MMELAKKMSKLEVFLHVSTAYAHCYMKTIDEKFYIDEKMHSQDDEFWKRILSKDENLNIDDGKFPNPYTCSKAITESYLSKNCQNIPLVIIRPSIVVGAWKEPVPGWIDNFNGPTGSTHSLIRGVLIQSCSAGAKNFTNYVFCHPQISGVTQNIENHCAILSIIIKIINFTVKN